MNTKIPNNVLILMLISSILQQTALALPEENVLKPYDGPSIHGADSSTLTGKVMTGYQGWFNCEGDGTDLGWTHWARDRNKAFGPGNITVDLWPDVSEYDDDELYTTAFTYEDGTPAKTFSSHNRKTVVRHFRWMADYEIDGAFVQRFAHSLHDKTKRYHKDKVLSSAREGANRYGRTYAVMYDLTGVQRHAKQYWEQDVIWAHKHDIDYMPVVFPGFSWYNLKGTKLDSIPRLDGQFLWSQVIANKRAGVNMLYIAMFDEVDEGTAIFKCTNNPPNIGGSKFLTLDGLPGDFYLRLAGQAGKLLRDEIPLSTTVPVAR